MFVYKQRYRPEREELFLIYISKNVTKNNALLYIIFILDFKETKNKKKFVYINNGKGGKILSELRASLQSSIVIDIVLGDTQDS